jgi:hypothetical protein
MMIGDGPQKMSRDEKKRSQVFKQPHDKLKGKKEEGERRESDRKCAMMAS